MNYLKALAASLLLVSATTAGARPSEKFELPDWNTTPVEDRDLGHGVHMLESFGGNIGVLAGDEGVLLVDAEWPQLHDKVLAAVSKISKQPVCYLVNTHWHWDHVGGDGLFAKAGVVIFSSEQTREYIAKAQASKASPPGSPYAPDPAAIPVVTVTDGVKFHVGGQTVELIKVPPAHTNGDLIVHYIEADVIQTG